MIHEALVILWWAEMYNSTEKEAMILLFLLLLFLFYTKHRALSFKNIVTALRYKL